MRFSPKDTLVSFLPSNVSSGRGEGYITFEDRVKSDVPDQMAIADQAKIILDVNEPILTPSVTVMVGELLLSNGNGHVFMPFVKW